MKVCLLDVNVLIALAWPVHIHHAQAGKWFNAKGHKGWATCPLTQLAFVRISSNPAIIRDAVRPEQALDMLKTMSSHSGHHFWPDDRSVSAPNFSFSAPLTGHRQVADAYLLALAIRHGGALATFDQGLTAVAKNASDVEQIVG